MASESYYLLRFIFPTTAWTAVFTARIMRKTSISAEKSWHKRKSNEKSLRCKIWDTNGWLWKLEKTPCTTPLNTFWNPLTPFITFSTKTEQFAGSMWISLQLQWKITGNCMTLESEHTSCSKKPTTRSNTKNCIRQGQNTIMITTPKPWTEPCRVGLMMSGWAFCSGCKHIRMNLLAC